MKNLIKKLVPKLLVGWYHFILAFLGALYYGFPSRKLTVIAITGTHGKTTTVNLAGAILEEAGYKTAIASSIKFKIAGREQENKLKMTMPGRAFLQKFLKQAVKANCTHAILEVTSEGVLQHRHRFINFNTIVFTNLFREHLERHGGFDNYKKAKAEYFKKCRGTHILNLDDENTDYYLQFSANKKIGYTIIGKTSREVDVIKVDNIQENDKGATFEIQGEQFNINLIGRFNVYNALSAVSIGLSQGVSLSVASEALANVPGMPGRMENVISTPFKVIVDYAFTPDALTKVYKTLNNSNLICVLGACGGGRDKWKRPELGKIAQQYCKEIIITNEDPYDENPMDIINQVAGEAGSKVNKILDRREAINKALTMANTGDTVIITGKGNEPWICAENGKKIPWDDREVTREEFNKLKIQ